jgi:hypothetical protein
MMVTSRNFRVFSALLLAACVPAFAQTPSNPSSTPSSTSGPTQAATPVGDQSTGSASGQPAAHQASGSSKPAPVCFKLTGRCVEPASSKQSANGSRPGQTTGAQGTAGAKAATTGQKPLNLTAPDVRSVVPAEELKEPLPTNEQIVETQEDGTVAVKGEKTAPDVPGGFGALWWALNHPSQAWRIFAPAE